ncbi:MAG: leucine-rich repeat protein [Clostridia bacterium]|nr:leucine-rich repeat protein [Clostridia bacterium]
MTDRFENNRLTVSGSLHGTKLLLPCRITVLLLLFAVAAPLFAGCGSPEYALVSEGNRTAEGLIYSLYENGDAEVTGSDAPADGILRIPGEADGHRVVSVGGGAFSGRQDFFAVIIGKNVKKIGASAFSGCSALTFADLENASELCAYAFSDCPNLTHCENLSDITALGDSVFEGDSSLTSAVFSKKLKTVGASVFYGCSSLTFLILPESVRSCGADLCFDCGSLVYAELRGLEDIPERCFTKCSSLTTVTAPKIRTVGAQAFRNCASLYDITLPRSLREIGDSAFSGCSSIGGIGYAGSTSAWSRITVAPGNEELKGASPVFSSKTAQRTADLSSEGSGNAGRYRSAVFSATSGEPAVSGDFTYVTDSDGCAMITAYSGTSSAAVIPSEIDGRPVTAVGDFAFSENTTLVSVEFPDSVISVGDGAFAGCTSLSAVNGGGKIRNVGIMAFEDTPWLAAMTQEFATVFDSVLIKYTGSTPAVKIPSGIKHIAGGTFTTREGLYFADLGSDVLSVGNQAFAFCPDLRLVCGPSVVEIGKYAFSYCEGLKSFELPSLCFAGEYAVADCHTLRYFGCSGSVNELGGSILMNCQNLRLFRVPDGIEKLHASCFDSCMPFIFLSPYAKDELISRSVEDGDMYISDMLIISGYGG